MLKNKKNTLSPAARLLAEKVYRALKSGDQGLARDIYYLYPEPVRKDAFDEINAKLAADRRGEAWRFLGTWLMCGVSLFTLASSSMPPDAKPWHDDARDTPAVAAIKGEFARTALGRDMLDFAVKNGIRLVEDGSLPARGALGEYDANTKTASVHTDMTMAEKTTFSAHEYRHAWQDVVLKYNDMDARALSPQQRWALFQHVEGDACAFSAYYAAGRRAQMFNESGGRAWQEFRIAEKLRGTYSQPGKPDFQARYFEYAVKSCYAQDGRTHFNNHLDWIKTKAIADTQPVRDAAERLRAGDVAGARERLDAYDKHAATAPSDAEFAAYLRRFGGVMPEAGAATAFAGVADKVLLENLPMAGLKNEDKRKTYDEIISMAGQSRQLAAQAAASLRAALPTP